MKVQNLIRLFILPLLLKASIVFGQSFSGTDFWFAFPENVGNEPGEINVLTVDIISPHQATGTVSIPLDGWSQNFTAAPGGVTTVTVPYNRANHEGVSDAIRKRGVHVVADSSIIVYAGNMRIYSSDAATAIPTNALGTEYEVTNYGDAAQGQAQIIIIGTEDNTTVNINPACRTVNNATWGSFYPVTINKGETYQIQAYNGASVGIGAKTHYDLTGTIIDSDKPVAVYSANVCAIPGGCLYCDNLFEQIRPKSTWGTEYYLAFTSKTSLTPDVVRILAGTNGTSYTYNGIAFNLNKGEFRDHDVLDAASIFSNQPIMVTQFLRGAQCSTPPAPIDPLLMDVIPAAQFASEYQFASSSFGRFTGGHLATVIIESGQEGTLELNGNPVGAAFTPIPNTTYSYGFITLAPGTYYEILSNNGSRFGLFVYGYGSDESYGYVAGGNLVDLNGCPTVDFSAADVCIGQDVKFFDASVDPKYNMVDFTWDFGDTQTLNYNAQQTIVNHTYAAPGIYNVTLTITNDGPDPCTKTLTKIVTVHDLPTFWAGDDFDICLSDSADMNVGDAAVANGLAPYTYDWSTDLGQFDDNTLLQPKFWSNTDGVANLSIEITDDNGCINTDDIVVTVLPADVLTLAPSDPVCEGTQPYFVVDFTTTDIYDIVLNDGTNNFNFNNIQDGDTLFLGFLTQTTNYTIVSANLSSGSDACIIFDTDPLEVKVRPLPDIDIAQNTNFCQGSDVDLTFDLFGNAGPWNFEYTDGTNTYIQNGISNSSIQITHTPAGTETYTVNYVEYSVDPKCRQAVTDAVTVTSFPMPTVTFTGAQPICEGDNLNLVITLTGTGPWEVDILDDGILQTITVPANGSPYNYTVSPTANTDYEVTAVRMVNDPFCETTVSLKQTVVVNEHKKAGTGKTLDWCAETTIDLFDELTNSPDAGGLWTDLDNAQAQGATLNTLTGEFLGGSSISAGAYRFEYKHDNAAPCPDETAIVILNIFENPQGGLSITSPICKGNSTPLTFSFPKGQGPFDVNLEENGTPVTPALTNISDGHSINVTPTVTTTYSVTTITDGSPANCQSTVNLSATVVVNDAPTLTIIDNPCDVTETLYKWKLAISGGDPASYSLDALNSTVTGTITEETPGNWVFTSDWIPSGTSASIAITDANGCPVNVFTKAHKCNCVSDAGDIDTNPQIVCGNNTNTISETAVPNVGPGDEMDYILCDNVVNGVVVNEHARNKTGMFSLASNPGLTVNTQYYVVRVVGDDDGNGEVDMADLCLSFSQLLPVTFQPNPAVNYTVTPQICLNDDAYLVFEFTSGTPDFDVTINPGGIYSFNTLKDSIKVNPTAIQLYTLQSVTDANGCSITPNTTETVQVHPLPTASFNDDVSGFVCANANEVNLSYAFTGTADYSITYTTNGNNPTTVAPVNNGSTAIKVYPTTSTNYTITNVTDANGCSNTGGTTQITVGSYPQLTLALKDDTICLGDAATLEGTVSGGQPHYYSDLTWDTHTGTYGAVNANISWFFYPTTTGSHAVTFTNFHDSSPTNCAGTIAPVVLTVVETPVVSFNVEPGDICEAQTSTQLNLLFTKGTAPFEVDYRENGVLKTASGLGTTGANDFITVYPQLGNNTYEIVAVRDANDICEGAGLAPRNIYRYKTPSFDIPSDITVCEGTTIDFDMTIYGDNKPIAFDYTVNGVGSVKQVTVGDTSFQETVYSNTTITVNLMRYNDPSIPQCLNSGLTKTMNITVVPIADVSITDDAVICSGETYNATFSANSAETFTVTYTDGTIQNAVSLKDGETFPLSPSDSTAYTLVSVFDQTSVTCPANFIDSTIFVAVNPLPVVDLIVPEGICLGDSILITMIPEGNTPLSYNLNNGEGEQQVFNSISDSTEYHYVPSDGITTAEVWVSNVSDNTISDASGNACTNDLSALKVTTKVNSLPTGTVKLGDKNICDYEISDVTFNIENGVGPFTVEYTINGEPKMYTNYNSGMPQGVDPMPEGTYYFNLVKITDSAQPYGCESTPELSSIDSINVHPKPVVEFESNYLKDCGPMTTEFLNQTDSLRYYGDAIWSFGRTSSQTSYNWPSAGNTFKSAGYYDIALMIRTEHGCINTHTKEDYVQVYPDPVVSYIYQPNPANLSDTRIHFFNETVSGSTYLWTVDTVSDNGQIDSLFFTERDPMYMFNNQEPGEYEVLLESWSEFGCYSNYKDVVHITGELLVNIPNAFTPNEDGTNDYFRPYVFGHTDVGFSFTVYNRWGELLYEINQYPAQNTEWKDYGWDGTHHQTGEVLPDGTYIYKLVVQNKYNYNFEEFTGEVHLLR